MSNTVFSKQDAIDALAFMSGAIDSGVFQIHGQSDEYTWLQFVFGEHCKAVKNYIESDDKQCETDAPDNVQFVTQSVEYVGGYGGADTIESAARTCTDTDSNNTDGFVRSLVSRGHMSPTEFGFADFRIVVDRGIQQELTRHRHLSFNIESTRWIDYGKHEFSYIVDPVDGWNVPEVAVERLKRLCYESARCYEDLLALGAPRDYARKALLLCTASKMRVAGNFRAWAEMIGKRIGKRVHPEFRSLATSFKEKLSEIVPPLLDE